MIDKLDDKARTRDAEDFIIRIRTDKEMKKRSKNVGMKDLIDHSREGDAFLCCTAE